MTRNITILAALTGCMVLAGCNVMPDFRRGERMSNPFSSQPGTATPPGTAQSPSANSAETACLEAARAAGFDVQGVVGTREVLGSGGLPQSRDVILRVVRGTQTVELRCSYTYLDGSAQIMTL